MARVVSWGGRSYRVMELRRHRRSTADGSRFDPSRQVLMKSTGDVLEGPQVCARTPLFKGSEEWAPVLSGAPAL